MKPHRCTTISAVGLYHYMQARPTIFFTLFTVSIKDWAMSLVHSFWNYWFYFGIIDLTWIWTHCLSATTTELVRVFLFDPVFYIIGLAYQVYSILALMFFGWSSGAEELSLASGAETRRSSVLVYTRACTTLATLPRRGAKSPSPEEVDTIGY